MPVARLCVDGTLSQDVTSAMRVLFLSQHCEPEPITRVFPLACALARRDHEVEILTGFPNYPGGRIYEGYRNCLLQRETINGVPIVRVPLYPDHGRNPFKRIWSALSLSLSTTLWGLRRMKLPDIVFCYGHPTIVWAAQWLQRHHGVPWVYDVQDLWPDTVMASGIVPPRPLMKMLSNYVNSMYRQASGLTVISRGLRDALIGRGIAQENLSVIYNWCDETRLQVPPPDEALRRELGLNGRFVAMYAGNMGMAQGLETLVEAAALLRDRLPAAQVVFVGGGVKANDIQALARSKQLTNVTFVPPQPLDKVGRMLSIADAQLVHLLPHPLFDLVIPSKTQSSLLAGKPVLMAARGSAAELVENSGGGIICEPGNAESVASGIERLHGMGPQRLRAMGIAGRSFYDRELSLELGAQRFEEAFSTVIERARRNGSG